MSDNAAIKVRVYSQSSDKFYIFSNRKEGITLRLNSVPVEIEYSVEGLYSASDDYKLYGEYANKLKELEAAHGKEKAQELLAEVYLRLSKGSEVSTNKLKAELEEVTEHYEAVVKSLIVAYVGEYNKEGRADKEYILKSLAEIKRT